MPDLKMNNENNIPEKCPHCGYKLSPWQIVLLNVDKELICKNCWYRIYLSPQADSDDEQNNQNKKFPEDRK